ncbi:MAG TPA: HEAT repeat domain-containing protein [Geobacteraceae bacterium]
MLKPCEGATPVAQGVAGKTIGELLLLVGDAGKGLRQEAMGRLLELGLDTCCAELENAVRNDDDADLRNGAMEAFVGFGPAAVPKLVMLLDDDNEEVRNFSTVMLGDIGSRTAVEPLIRLLSDPDANVRHGAAEALAKIGDRRAVPPLRRLLRGDYWDNGYAVAALGKLGGE